MKRKTDEAGTGIEFTGDDSTIQSLRRAECFDSQRARLLKVAETPQLRQEAEALLPLFPELKRYTARREAALEHELIEEQIVALERRAIHWKLAPKMHRDDRRQAGTKKQRGSRWPALDRWLDQALKQEPEQSTKELWRMLELDDPNLIDPDCYVDCDKIVKTGTDQELTFRGFEKRVTTARRRRK